MNEQEIQSCGKLLRGIVVSAKGMQNDPLPDLEELSAMRRCVDRIMEFAQQGRDRVRERREHEGLQ